MGGLVGKAQAGQVLVGNFQRPLDPLTQMIDTIMFMARAEKLLAKLQGVIIGEHEIREIRAMVTGRKPRHDVAAEGKPLPVLTFGSGRLALSLLVVSAAIVYFVVRLGG